MKLVLHQLKSRHINFDNSLNTNGIGCLSLLNGIVACGCDKILHYSQDGDLFYFQLFKQICSHCEGPVSFHYHAFHLLLLWYKKLKATLKDLRKKNISSETIHHIFTKTLQLIWLNWGSPVEDVPGLVTDIFRFLMDAASMVLMLSKMIEIVFDKMTLTPWFVKGKYRVLSILQHYVGIEQVTINYITLKEPAPL